MSTPAPPFTPTDPATLPGPPALAAARRKAWDRFAAGPLPSEADEIWRYSRVGDLDPGRWRPAERPSGPVPDGVARLLARTGARAGLVVCVDGHLVRLDPPEHAQLGPASDGIDELSASADPWDAFAELNAAQAPDPIILVVPPAAVIEDPIVVCHWAATAGAATFPRVVVRVGRGAQVTVVEYHASDDIAAWVDPVTELHLDDGAHLTHVMMQELGLQVWQTAMISAVVGRDAVLRATTVALGGEYARVRTDSVIRGTAGSAQLAALYCGSGSQMHDFRTLQDHDAPRSASDLLFKGAVRDEARSAYSGLIRVRRGAVGTRAFQTNRNLVLSDTGLATYSVPNLDIEENDVSCSHASATGPIDADQRFYLESRGIPPEVAERLIVLGFFADVVDRVPVAALREHVDGVVGVKLGVARG